MNKIHNAVHESLLAKSLKSHNKHNMYETHENNNHKTSFCPYVIKSL
jgi:hypothetical protein